jgi:hypothetical protein
MSKNEQHGVWKTTNKSMTEPEFTPNEIYLIEQFHKNFIWNSQS